MWIMYENLFEGRDGQRLWLIACWVFEELIELDFACIVYIELDWIYVDLLTWKRKKREMVNVYFQQVS